MADQHQLVRILEAALLAAGRPLDLDNLLSLFPEAERPQRAEIKAALETLAAELAGRAVEMKEVAGGYRLQIPREFTQWVSRLWEERPPRYSRALMETLAIIAYRQPITRGEIEDIRGVSVSTNIVRTLLDRHWIRAVGHRDVPGRPTLFGTTRDFLDYFGLKTLDELPTLAEIKDLDDMNVELDLAGTSEAADEGAPVTETEADDEERPSATVTDIREFAK